MSTPGDVHTLAQQIQTALHDGRIADAARLTERRRASAPDDPNTDLFSGIVAYKRNRYADAIACFDRIRQRHPSNATASFWLGNALRHAGRFDEAETAYRAVPTADARVNLESTQALRKIENAGRHA